MKPRSRGDIIHSLALVYKLAFCFFRCVMTNDKGEEKSKKCVFPFVYLGRKFEDCTNDGETNPSDFWCATEVDRNGILVVNIDSAFPTFCTLLADLLTEIVAVLATVTGLR